MEKIGCFIVGLGLFSVGIVITIGLIWVLGLPLYRLEHDQWPWQSSYSSFNEVIIYGFGVVIVLALMGMLLYPSLLMLSDLGCWALKGR